MMLKLALILCTLTSTASAFRVSMNGQPGGRKGCCYKSSSYLSGISMSMAAVPDAATPLVEKLKASLGTSTLKENLALIEEMPLEYTAVAFSCGAVDNPSDANQASAKLLSLSQLLDLDKDQTLELWGDIWREVRGTEGDSHMNIREFEKGGMDAVKFPDGLALKWL